MEADLDRAEAFFKEALSIEPRNRIIQHSMAELALRRSRLAIDPLEREAWRRAASGSASALTAGSINSYPHHTLLKAAIDDVRDWLATVEGAQPEANVARLGDSIAHAEDVFKGRYNAFLTTHPFWPKRAYCPMCYHRHRERKLHSNERLQAILEAHS